MVIEKLTHFDADVLRDINRLMSELSVTSQTDEQLIREAVGDGNSHIYIIRDEERIIGCGALCVMHTLEQRLASIEHIVVSEDYRGQGLGEMLMRRMLTDVRTLAPITLHLTSNSQRVAANQLYRKLGFVKKDTNFYELKNLDD